MSKHFKLILPDEGRDIYTPCKTQTWGYRYGPTLMVEGGVCHAWFASPGDGCEADWFTYRRSEDGGKTWTDPQPLEGVYGAPPHFLLHSSGALILTYGRRRYGDQGQYARISRDGGKTWGKDFMVSPVAPDWDQGYPSSAELSNGDIFTLYYQKYEGDDYPSLLGTRWSLDEEPK